MAFSASEPGIPIAYFITWTCYGARLHGDSRDSVDRRWNNLGVPRLAPNSMRMGWEKRRLSEPPVLLDERSREAVKAAMEEVARFREWHIFAANIRTNHVHVVIAAPIRPETVMTTLKAWATRRLRSEGLTESQRIWTRHGSTRYLWDERAVEAACHYVLYRQDDGDELPV